MMLINVLGVKYANDYRERGMGGREGERMRILTHYKHDLINHLRLRTIHSVRTFPVAEYGVVLLLVPRKARTE